MQPIIEVNNLWKQYKIAGQREKYLSFRDSFQAFFKNSLAAKKETFWALQDLNFQVNPGECVGIIGKNGAGKSTLLKILSRITPPTKGSIKFRGRLASLLEVGTGFHYELTGRENIYLNGSILGLKRAEINQQFDAIVAFSGVEQFLETPLKHYSNGMQLRLAFAVAAHLQPEILVIDEILAVGDAEFQKKCLGKMNEVSASGRTVLFVSHDMSAVQQLCNKGIYMQEGQIREIGAVQSIINSYLQNANPQQQPILTYTINAQKTAQILKVMLSNSVGKLTNQLKFGEPFEVQMTAFSKEELPQINPVVRIYTAKGNCVLSTKSRDTGNSYLLKQGTNTSFKVQFSNLMLTPGSYYLSLALEGGKDVFYEKITESIHFEILDLAQQPSLIFNNAPGLVQVYPEWTLVGDS